MEKLGPFDKSEIEVVSDALLKIILNTKYKVWCFNGGMGAGKTTLISSLLKTLGIEDQVSSPTYPIINEYLSLEMNAIYHFDFYRISKEQEALDIGTLDYFYSDNFCFIEWSSQIPNLLPDEYGIVTITINEKTLQRTLKISTNGE